jgi:hypothetical protein
VHVDQLAVAVLADADLLQGHAHDAVAGDPPGDPFGSAASLGERTEVQRQERVGVWADGEALGRGAAAQGLVGSVGVVLER